jgi:hypothetical protein
LGSGGRSFENQLAILHPKSMEVMAKAQADEKVRGYLVLSKRSVTMTESYCTCITVRTKKPIRDASQRLYWIL